jgi:hypothetical protein
MGDREMDTPEVVIEKAVRQLIVELEPIFLTDNDDLWIFSTCILENRFRGAIKRVLHLSSLADGFYSEDKDQDAFAYEVRSSEVRRQFFVLLKDAASLTTMNRELIEDLMFQVDDLLDRTINELRMMGK